MRIIKIILSSALLVLFITGCASSPNPVTRQPLVMTPESPRVNPSAEVAAAEPQKVAEVIRSKVVVYVDDVSKGSDSDTHEIAKKTEGRLIADGFTVKKQAPFLSVNIGSELTEFDKTGNYYVYEGKSEASITRIDSKVLGKKEFVERGKRDLEKSRAKRAVATQLADSISQWVSDTATTETMGLESVIITLRISEWTSWFGGNEKVAKRKIDEFMNEVRKMDGIMSCHLVDSDTNNRLFRFRVIYQAEKFQNGVFTGVVTSKKIPGNRVELNPVLWLIKTVFGTAKSAL